MVIIEFVALDKKDQQRLCTFIGETLEECFDCLSMLTRNNWRLIEASIVDGDKRTPLPVEVFDGSFFTGALRLLNNEMTVALK